MLPQSLPQYAIYTYNYDTLVSRNTFVRLCEYVIFLWIIILNFRTNYMKVALDACTNLPKVITDLISAAISEAWAVSKLSH